MYRGPSIAAADSEKDSEGPGLIIELSPGDAQQSRAMDADRDFEPVFTHHSMMEAAIEDMSGLHKVREPSAPELYS